MNILVTGSLGQLGREVRRQLALSDSLLLPGKIDGFGKKDELHVTGVDLGELDISDLNATMTFCHALKPDVIINCAAHTAVDICESEPDAAYRANALGPRNLAMAAEAMGVKLVHISTDYVFDGEGLPVRQPGDGLQTVFRHYHEFDRPNPKTVYGRSKLAGEHFVQQFCSRWFILRTAWLYGDGSNFVKTMLKLASERSEVRVVADQSGTPTSTRVLTACILELMQTEAYGLYHATCEGETTWHGFTEEIFRQRGLSAKVIPVTTAEFPRPAPRPKYSVLDNSMLRMGGFASFPSWQDELESYLKALP